MFTTRSVRSKTNSWHKSWIPGTDPGILTLSNTKWLQCQANPEIESNRRWGGVQYPFLYRGMHLKGARNALGFDIEKLSISKLSGNEVYYMSFFNITSKDHAV